MEKSGHHNDLKYNLEIVESLIEQSNNIDNDCSIFS